MTKKVEWRLREVTKYELVRSYSETTPSGVSGGSELIGTYDTEDQGRHAMRVFKEAEEENDHDVDRA